MDSLTIVSIQYYSMGDDTMNSKIVNCLSFEAYCSMVVPYLMSVSLDHRSYQEVRLSLNCCSASSMVMLNYDYWNSILMNVAKLLEHFVVLDATAVLENDA